MDQANRDRMTAIIGAMLDDENAADLDTFGREVLNNGRVWDILADSFPDARSSDVKTAMLEAFRTRQPKES
ncbi:hypothetical protein [Magnetospirillum sp. UT-4]|uniref:hypothetical protein n=1 Tax=Magnetospirillum sp. UT-4 TaxID=2681467 RepID=UPI001381C58E|nr:hypothetical protein [Magnetospirillum sp. UT-4]CAA7611558.1 conserved hypothetical protein [Magnetospirillum sp. UT-4]